MLRIVTLMTLALLAVSVVPCPAAAGGAEFPGGGARAIGRGSSNFARADDPNLMVRNPALLSDLWSDMALAGANVLLADSCFQATGTYGSPFGYRLQGNDVVNFGDGAVFINPLPGSTDLNGVPLPRVSDETFPQVCYSGPVPILPHVAVSMKLTPRLGIGLGFFPPDLAALNQFGNRDGTVETPNGLRSSPTRWFRAHQNTSYFSALGAVGYRLADWLTVGAGFQWSLVVYSTTTFSRVNQYLSSRDDVRSEVFGRDLFIPGLIASAQITPIDNLDIAFGFKWSDRVESTAKVDATTGAFGNGANGQLFRYKDSMGTEKSAGSAVPTTTQNIRGTVSAPPIWAPQLSFGLRYADRLTPRVKMDSWNAAHAAAGKTVDDSMTTERWDIEADAIMYFNSVSDFRKFENPGRSASLVAIGDDGTLAPTTTIVGACTKRVNNDPMGTCLQSESPAILHGKNHLSLRVGGDYNVLPGVLSVRIGGSYETDGADPRYNDITNYMLGRTGLHVGATLRVAKKTDISIGYVHFIQKTVKLTPNLNGAPVPTAWTMDPNKYHLATGKTDGTAGFPITDSSDPGEGPLFANAGEYFYHLDVISVDLAQHF
jgi:hypothetical protein